MVSKKFLNNCRENKVVFVNMTATLFAAMLPVIWKYFSVEAFCLIILLIFVLSFLVLNFEEPTPVHVHDNNLAQSQWEIYDLLIKWHRKKVSIYWSKSIIGIVSLIVFSGAMTYYYNGPLNFTIRNIWWIIPLYLLIYFTSILWYIWKAYKYSIAYFDSDFAQILWKYIEELIERLQNDNNKSLYFNLDEIGKYSFLKVMEKLRNGKIKGNLSFEELIEVIDAETKIIEQLKSKIDDINNQPSFLGEKLVNAFNICIKPKQKEEEKHEKKRS